ncbi:MAG: glycosyltransferase [Cyanobacteria bacterium RI_101]|nr:glycosyltransferase [Cyanobacteria bacterium RI_101]
MSQVNSPELTPTPEGPLVVPHAPASLKFSLVLPTFNEGENIPEILATLTALLDPVLGADYELILVDDDSPDLTWKTALALLPQYPQAKVIRRQGEKGLSTAVIRGWQAARGEILGVMDADLQHPPEILLELLREMDRGADLAVASRHVEGGGVSEWSGARRLLSRGAQVLGLMILPEVLSRLSDPMSGYFTLRRSAIAGRILSPLGYKILIEVAARGRTPWLAEVGYVFRERQSGESKVTWRQYAEYLRHLLRLRLSRSSRFLRFAVVGAGGVAVDMAALFIFSDPQMLAWGLTRSKLLAAELAIVHNFLWNDFWTFGDVARRQPGNRRRLKRFVKFNLICGAGLILNVLLLNLFFNGLGFNRYLANLFAIALVTIWNFWLNLKLSWRVTEVEPPPRFP